MMQILYTKQICTGSYKYEIYIDVNYVSWLQYYNYAIIQFNILKGFRKVAMTEHDGEHSISLQLMDKMRQLGIS